jgi:hypothetical protein
MSHQTGIRLAEISALLITIAGVWLAAAEIPQLKLARTRVIVSGTLLAVAGILMIIAYHWGRLG